MKVLIATATFLAVAALAAGAPEQMYPIPGLGQMDALVEADDVYQEKQPIPGQMDEAEDEDDDALELEESIADQMDEADDRLELEDQMDEADEEKKEMTAEQEKEMENDAITRICSFLAKWLPALRGHNKQLEFVEKVIDHEIYMAIEKFPMCEEAKKILKP